MNRSPLSRPGVRRLISASALLAVLGAGALALATPASAGSKPKQGAACKKEGKLAQAKGKTFKCSLDPDTGTLIWWKQPEVTASFDG